MLTISIFFVTLMNIQAQTIEITSEQLKQTNKIFAEHKQQNKIIKEQNSQIQLFEKKVDAFEIKVNILNQVIENKDSIFSLTEKKHQYQTLALEEKASQFKKQKNQMTLIAILSTLITIGAIFLR